MIGMKNAACATAVLISASHNVPGAIASLSCQRRKVFIERPSWPRNSRWMRSRNAERAPWESSSSSRE
jgi:hypothetical protein